LGGLVLFGLVLAGVVRAYREADPYIKDWLEIRQVTILGATQVTTKEVLGRLALPPRATQLSIDADRLASKLRTHPWVRDASVTRRLPHGLEVRLNERRAAASLQNGNGSLLLDEDGHVLSVSLVRNASAEEAPLPVLVGIEPNALMQGEAAARAAVKSAVEVAALVESLFPFSIQPAADGTTRRWKLQVDVTNPENVVAHVNGLRFQFGASGFEEKWERYRRVQSDLQLTASVGDGAADARSENRLQAHEIDLRYQDKVIVRERG
jgi:cell division protein FtsQ